MNEPNDKAFDDYLRRDTAVSQRYRELDEAAPPPALDAAILAQARAAVARPKQSKATWVRWGAPLALAASGVMAVAIVLEIGVEAPEMRPTAQQEEVASPPVMIDMEVKQSAPVMMEAPAADAVEAVVQQPAFAPAPRAALREEAQPAAERRESDSGFTAAASQAEPSPFVELSQTPVNPLAKASSGAGDDASAADRARTANEAENSRSRAARAMTPAAAPPAAAPATAIPQSSSRSPVLNAVQLEPQPWLEQIRQLRREGKLLEADELWTRFVAAYPDYVVESTDIARPAPRQ